MTPRRAVLGAIAAVLLALLLTGCASRAQVEVQMDRTGRGAVTLALVLDASSLQALGLSSSDPQAIADRMAALLDDGGWYAPDGGEQTIDNVFAFSDDDEGGVTLRTRKDFDNTDGLDAIMGHPRPLRPIVGEGGDAVFAGLPDLPSAAPLLNDFTFRLGSGTGDSPGFTMFGRGGVGDIGDATCQGDRATGFSKALRDSLELRYRFVLPGGPGRTNADETPGGANVWLLRYEDCDPLQADQGAGSSSTVFNGVVLAALAAFLVFVFVARGIRRRRARPGA